MALRATRQWSGLSLIVPEAEPADGGSRADVTRGG